MESINNVIKSLGGRKAVVSMLTIVILTINVSLASYFLMNGMITGDQWILISSKSIEVCIAVLGVFSLANVAATKFSVASDLDKGGEDANKDG